MRRHRDDSERAAHWLGILGSAALLVTGAARAQDFPAIDLAAIARGEGGFAVRGEGQPGSRGSGVMAAAGDVNGDGLPDLIARGSICVPGECSAAPAYVVFGARGGASIELAEVEAGRGGFAISGVAPGDLAGAIIEGPGDVNGDGLDDVLIGAPAASEAYVVYGKADGAAVGLAEVREGRGGFALRGAALNEYLKAASAGDVNGDGLADLLVSAPSASPEDRKEAGEAFVVFGKADGTAVELPDIEAGRGGFAIRGIAAGDGAGWMISGAGDGNGDGFADIVICTRLLESHIVFGKTDGAAVELSDVRAGQDGFAVHGGDLDVAGVGDVNGDGLADVLFGGSPCHVLFGKRSTEPVELTEVAASQGGFAISGGARYVAGAGDVNGDGLADVMIGYGSNTSYVVFGKPGGSVVELTDVEAGQGGFAIRGIPEIQTVGSQVAGGGDLNGDGLADLLIDVLPTPNSSPWLPGDGHVVFGKPDGAPVELADIAAGQGGFTVRGIKDRNEAALRVTVAGDVNGDGLADVVTGAVSRHLGLGRVLSREAHVVFGKPDGSPVELAETPAGKVGFLIRSIPGRELTGGIAGAGDVNGDGLDDVLLGAPEASPGGRISVGETYVVFGKRDGERVDLAEVLAGRGGFAIRGAMADDLAGLRCAGAGDVNGDGLADVAIGGRVVFGKPDGALVELSAVEAGRGGFAIHKVNGGKSSEWNVAGAGDVNGDGLADVVIGTVEGYVVFGKPDGAPVELADVLAGQGGFGIRRLPGRYLGASVAGAGDVNGDALADVLVGEGNFQWDGSVYVVFGKTNGTPVESATIRAGQGGFAILGSDSNNTLGSSVSGAGDWNGDGLDDVLIGAARQGHEWYLATDSYVVFGKAGGAAVEISNLPASEGFAVRGAPAQGEMRLDVFGATVAGAGDIDGDGLADDLVIAGGLPDALYPRISGAAYVIFGPRDGSERARFRRGAVRGEGQIDIADAIVLLGHLFLGGEAPPCLDAADADDSGRLDLSDAIGILGHLFLGTGALPAPGATTCGLDPTADELRCARPGPGCAP